MIKFLRILSFILICTSINGQTNEQLSILEKNWKHYLLMEEMIEGSENHFFSLKEDGTFPDLDYSNRQKGNWPLHDHLKRAVEMAKAYKKKDHKLYTDAKLLKNILLAYDFWVNKDMVNENWWYPQIGVPQSMGLIMLLMKDEINKTQWDKGIKIMNRVEFGTKTGQNLVWVSSNIILRSILVGDATLVLEASAKIKNEMQMVEGKEGLQTDYSFHQHGTQLQFGNYGLHFLEDQVKWMFILKDSKYDYTLEQRDLMRNYFAEGQRWVIWKEVYDINSSGRQLFPNEQFLKYKRVYKAASEMKDIDAKNSQLYKSILNGNKVYGSKYFPKSALTIQRKPDYFCSIRMCSDKILGSESGNGENLSGYYLADGGMYVMKTGQEYFNIYPYWNWRQIPGTTAVQDTVKLPEIGWSSYHIKSDFVGGLTFKDLTVSTMQYRRDSVEANKSYFIAPDFIVCLGSGIKGTKNQQLQTTIEQSFLSQNPEILDNGFTVTENSSEKGKFKTIIHGQTGYSIENANAVVVSNEDRKGDWTKVLDWLPKTEPSRPIFTLGIEHGKSPDNASYAYTVYPSIKEKELLRKEKKKGYSILKNSENIQAVQFDKLKQTAIVFHQAGTVQLDKNLQLTSSFAGVVIVRKKNSCLSIAVLDPTAKVTEGNIVLTGNVKIGTYNKKENTSTIAIDFSKNTGIPIFISSKK